MDRLKHWNENEFGYCVRLVRSRGDDNVGRSLDNISAYLFLQAHSSRHDKEWEISSRLACAAQYIDEMRKGRVCVSWDDVEHILS